MADKLLSYKYLFDGSSPQWCLVKVRDDEENPYLIVDVESRMALLIEDDELGAQIIKRMLTAGVKILLPNDIG